MQWNDIPSSRRKHFTAQSSLGQGLTPLEEQPMAPHLARRQQQPAERPLIAGPELPGAAQPLIQSTYQALCQHSPAGAKQASWRGQHADPPTRGIPPSSLMQYSSPFDRSAADQQSQIGMSQGKCSPFMPGYTGHIDRHASQTQGVQPRLVNKDLILENYRFNMPGFTGTRK